MRTIPMIVRKVLLGALALVVVGLVNAPASQAAGPSLDVSATDQLTDGQTITVDGSGFAPDLKGIAVGQCREGFEGPSDCNLAGGATFRNADSSGAFATVTIKLSPKFGDIDCATEQCVIAAEPLPTTSSPEEVAANSVAIPIYFGEKAPAADSTQAPVGEPDQAAVDTSTPATVAAEPLSGDLEVVSAASVTGGGDGLGAVLLAGVIGLLAGAGLMLGWRRRQGAVR